MRSDLSRKEQQAADGVSADSCRLRVGRAIASVFRTQDAVGVGGSLAALLHGKRISSVALREKLTEAVWL